MSLDCYKCTSVTNWDDCKKEEMTCPSVRDRCIKAYVKYGDTESFQKYCGFEAQCDKKTNPTCKLAEAFGVSECSVDCCEGDLCNAGSTAGVSGIVMMACALLVLFFLKA